MRIISLLFVESSTFVNCIFCQFRVTKILKSRHFFPKKVNIYIKCTKKYNLVPFFSAKSVKENFIILFIYVTFGEFRGFIIQSSSRNFMKAVYPPRPVPALQYRFCPRPSPSPDGERNSVPAPSPNFGGK